MDFRSIASVAALGAIAALLFPHRWKTAFVLGASAGGGVLLVDYLSSQVGPGHAPLVTTARLTAPAPVTPTIESTDVEGVSILRTSDGSVRIVNANDRPDPLGRRL